MKSIRFFTIIITILIIFLCCPVLGFNDKIIEYFSQEGIKRCNLTQNGTHINILCNVIVGFSSIEKNSIDNKPICFSNIRSKNFSIDKKNLMDNESRKIIFAMNFLNNTEFHEIQINATVNINNSGCIKNESTEIISNLGKISCYSRTYSRNNSDCESINSEKNSRRDKIQVNEPVKQNNSRTRNYDIELGSDLDYVNQEEENTTNKTILFDKNISASTGKPVVEKKKNFILLIILATTIGISAIIFAVTRH